MTRPADFLADYVDQATGLPLPSFDLWEERWGVHAFTVAAVIAGLRAAASLATEFGETERADRYRAGADRMLEGARAVLWSCLLYTSPSPRDISGSRMPSSA